MRKTEKRNGAWRIFIIIILLIGIEADSIAKETIKPNIVIIVSDPARTDHFSSYGYERNTTPKIDAFAKEGALFSYCISQGNWSCPALASLSLGTYPIIYYSGTSAYKNGMGNLKELSGEIETPVVLLKNSGYKIAAYNYTFFQKGIAADAVNKDSVFEWLEKNKNSTFILFYKTVVTHLPYNPVPPYNEIFFDMDFIASSETLKNMDTVKTYWNVHDKNKIARAEVMTGSKQGIARFSLEDKSLVAASYDGELRMLDDEAGALIKKVDALGLKDKTIVIVVGEHGEELLDRGHVGHSSNSLEGGLNDELMRVPLIIRYPPLIPKNVVIDRQVEQVDIMPTVLEMAEIKKSDFIKGESLLNLLKGEEEKYAKIYAFSFGAPAGAQNLIEDSMMLRSVRTERWKIIALEDTGNIRYELYDLKKDPLELRNVISQNVEIAENLKNALEDWYEKAEEETDLYKE